MLLQWLELKPGITTIIGSGGKTTLLRTLGTQLRAQGFRVLLCTTTKIYPFSDIPCITEGTEETLAKALAQHGLVCTGTPIPELGKLTTPELPFDILAKLADFVLVEGDGSAGLPLKAHLSHEPVIPPGTNQVICVVGLSGLNGEVQNVVHRPERFAVLSGQWIATPEAVAQVLNQESLADRYLLNQGDLPQCRRAGMALLTRLNKPVRILSLHTGELF